MFFFVCKFLLTTHKTIADYIMFQSELKVYLVVHLIAGVGNRGSYWSHLWLFRF
jgi:hypothetical protein